MTDVYVRKEDLPRWIAKHFKKDLISVDDLLECIEDLDSDVKNLKSKLEDLENDIEENYRRIPVAEQVGISDKDFY